MHTAENRHVSHDQALSMREVEGSEGGYSMAPPAFSLSAGPLQMTEGDSPGKKSDTARSIKVDNRKGTVGTYTIRKGDNITKIATHLGVEEAEIMKLNHFTKNEGGTLVDSNGKSVTLKEGEVLKVPSAGALNLGKGDAGKCSYLEVTGKAFLKGGKEKDIDPSDVKQGSLGDCYFMAGMIAIARTNPESIRELIVPQKDGTYNVTLYLPEDGDQKRTKKVINVTPSFPHKNKTEGNVAYGKSVDEEEKDGKNYKELWPALLEKAWAQYNHGYDAIEGGNPGKAMGTLTGKGYSYYKLEGKSEDAVKKILQKSMEENMATTIDSNSDHPDGKKFKHGIRSGHAYVFVKLDGDKVYLQNPWGSSHIGKTEGLSEIRQKDAVTIKELMEACRNIKVLKK